MKLWVDRRRVVEPTEKIAFVLAGGGNRGAVQVGMLAELVHRGIRADRVYGASVGAVNGAAYAGQPTPEGMVHLRDVWLHLSGEDVFPQAFVHGPWRFFQQRESVHSNDGLRRVIEEGVRFEQIEDATIPLEVVVTSLTRSEERWIDSGPVVESVLASAAIPAIFPPMNIDGELLVDGGVVNNVPISRAIEQGATKIYVLLCGPIHYTAPLTKRPIESLLSTMFVAIHARFPRDLAHVPPGVDVVVFPGGVDLGMDYRDFSETAELIEEGRRSVAAVLDGDFGRESALLTNGAVIDIEDDRDDEPPSPGAEKNLAPVGSKNPTEN